ncbi:MAG: 4Fe-4S binding protein, partial [Chloroflexi bacterium]|nr:4Fe-4S binding protein [Chloroflexota bacterium]
SYDTIIAAIGQAPDVSKALGVVTSKSNTIQVDKTNLSTNIGGVFAGGDAVLGPATVIEAIAAGRAAAISIDKYLGGKGIIDEVLGPVDDVLSRDEAPAEGWRPKVPTIPLSKAISTFEGVELSLPEEKAIKEAKRCLRCDVTYEPTVYRIDTRKCIFCGLCVEACPFDALFMGYGYENSYYHNEELILNKTDLQLGEKRQASSYYHPENDAKLSEQTLLINRDKVDK